MGGGGICVHLCSSLCLSVASLLFIMRREVQVGAVRIGGGRPLVFIGGTCMIEGRDSALRHAQAIRTITERLGMPFVYKSSVD